MSDAPDEQLRIDYASPGARDSLPLGTHLGRLACFFGAIATVLPLVSLYPMLTVPTGTSIRPMEQVLAMLCGSVVGVVLILPTAITAVGVSLWRHEPIRWPMWSLGMAIVSIAFAPVTFTVLMRVWHLTLAD